MMFGTLKHTGIALATSISAWINVLMLGWFLARRGHFTINASEWRHQGLIALATLAVYDAAALRQALADGDVPALTRVPGIGKRGAERMVLELRDKIGALPGASAGGPAGGHGVRGPVVEALVGLGFPIKQAEESCNKVLADDPDATTSKALRAALSLLGRK